MTPHDNPPITVIIGPTAIGKTDHSIQLASATNAHIISADTFQIYRHMDIGTAKVSPSIRKKIPHHLIDEKDPKETYSAAEFNQKSTTIIHSLTQQNTPIIICGGSGFYLRSFLYGYQFDPSTQYQTHPTFLSESEKDTLWEKLHQIDPKRAEKLHKNDTMRIQRALDIYKKTQTLSSDQPTIQHQLRSDVSIIGLRTERPLLTERINDRVDKMFKKGLIEEVRYLVEMGVNSTHQSMAALGYKETLMYLDGKITKDALKLKIKIKTRQFAKRQMTWFRKFDNVNWLTIN